MWAEGKDMESIHSHLDRAGFQNCVDSDRRVEVMVSGKRGNESLGLQILAGY